MSVLSRHGGARRRWTGTIALALAMLGAAIAAPSACVNGEQNQFTSSSSGGGASGPAGSSGSGGNGGHGGDGGSGLFGNTGGGLPMSGLQVTPASPTLTVQLPLSGNTMKFDCIDGKTKMPVANPTWSLDTITMGTIDANGLYTANGQYAGNVQVTCAANGDSAQTTLSVHIHAVDNSGGLTQQQQDTLRGPASASDPGWQFLYPYDQTVFPRGILAPEVHLNQGGTGGSTFYLHIASGAYEYEGFFNVSPSAPQLQMSQAAWVALTSTAGGTKVTVEVSKIANGGKVGPIARTWVLAAGTLHGTIYYNTYDSPLAGNNGAMMRIKGNSPTPEVLVGNCTVCHSISADGSTAAAANHSGPGGTFDLTGGQLNPPNVWVTSELAAFAALYPKGGSVLVINGAPGQGYPPNTPGTSGPWPSSLYTRDGTQIPNSGIESKYAMSPVFSHDGTMLAFNDRSPIQQNGHWPGGLALMDYDANTQKFSNYRVLAVPIAGRQYSWPAFTPDNKFVIYQDGTGEDLATWSGNTAKLYAVDVQTKAVVALTSLNADLYAPQGARDLDKNYEPTIAPIASGGYFWVMFTSRRTYGNKLTSSPDQTKRLWVAAIDINPQPGKDPSHPAFYISGQELTSGNSRGFWALDPCKADGQGCQTGDECCNGFCNPTNDPAVFVCGPPTGMCSDEFEPCVTAADCCDPVLDCIGGLCSTPPPN